MYGLLERDLEFMLEIFRKHTAIEEVIIFGSRAMGNYKKGSDIDLALKGKDVDQKVIRKVIDDLNEEYPLPYFFDVIHYEDIANEELREHVDSVGKRIL